MKRLRISVLILLLVLLVGYFCRVRLQRSLIAFAVYREHIFTPPAEISHLSGWSRFWRQAQFFWDLSALRMAREERLHQLGPSIKPLINEINRRQAEGAPMVYSMHIYREIRWRLNFTPDTAATHRRVGDLSQSLTQPAEQKLATEQQPSDGSWGAGIKVWYLRLYYSVDNLQDSDHARFPFSFLDRINSPEKLNSQLNSALYDSFTTTGIFNREELDETFSAVARLLNKKHPVAYPFHPQLDSALKDYVKRWQNPETGCWGQWMVDRHGQVWKMDDVGVTFHVISDLHGEVEHKDQVARRLLELDGIDFPAGIRFDGHYENHLNWDAIKIFRYAWPYLDSVTREKVRVEISGMIHWCLTESYQPDGSFKISDLDDNLGDAYRYGVAFLSETGFFGNKDRFWTDQKFPEAQAIQERIRARILSIGLGESGLRDAYETLNGKDF